MESLRAALCATLLALVALSAKSAHWVCAVSNRGTQLVCSAQPGASDAAPSASPAATTAVVNGTRFPLDPERTYTVEMWSTPTDADFVFHLARATICYRSPQCHVTLAPGPWLTAAGRR